MDSEEKRIEEAVNNAYEDLSRSEKQELKEIYEKLEEIAQPVGEESNPIEDKELKKKVAQTCLNLVEKTFNSKEDIAKTSYIITGNFGWFDYNDSLDEIMSIAGELEIPRHASKDPFDMFGKMKEKLEGYLKKTHKY